MSERWGPALSKQNSLADIKSEDMLLSKIFKY